MKIRRAVIKLEGVVQGVGFRPFIHRLSRRLKLPGSIRNTSAGVTIEVEGSAKDIRDFMRAIRRELPPLARITGCTLAFAPLKNYSDFYIEESRAAEGSGALVSPDIGLCPACEKELFDPRNRRFRYPFINCTDCGPRFSIIESLPYDRPGTTMRRFRMCPACRKEYTDMGNRRYHAQPNACPQCGPQVRLVHKGAVICRNDAAVLAAVRLLKKGSIVCVKGISGFHIACDAFNRRSVRKLRLRKQRPDKPFALMVRDIRAAERLCRVSALEEKLLLGPERPIVLLKKKNSRSPDILSPDNNYLGVMAPYAPLHFLLFDREMDALVMTSANEADEPVEADDASALNKLAGICDYFLLNDRPIANRADDSIVQVMAGRPVVLRRGRGYSPFPFFADRPFGDLVACGAELKNTFCLAKGKRLFLSQYIGDLNSWETLGFYTAAIAAQKKLFGVLPRTVVCDLHPDYLSTRYARDLAAKTRSLSLVEVQHHKAHAASVITEHRIRENVIAVCFDGIGYGEDGRIWGGEFFSGNIARLKRRAHLRYVPMPGGDQATREPYRMAMSYLFQAFGEKAFTLPIGLVRRHSGRMAPLLRTTAGMALTSSCGRLFDAVSALLGFCDIITYEAQAAIRLQKHAERSSTRRSYPFSVVEGEETVLDPAPCFRALAADIEKGVDPDDCSRAFHNGLAMATARVCYGLRRRTSLSTVCLSGGVFQNSLLLETLAGLLERKGFKVYFNELVPTNDGAVSLGQAAIAGALKREKRGRPEV